MRLWIDGQCLQTASRLRGIGRYVNELVRAIAENHAQIELLISFNAAMPNEALLAHELLDDIIDPKNLHVWHGAVTGGEAAEGYTPERRLSELAIAHHVNCLSPDVALSASPFEGSQDLAVPLLPERGCVAPIASIFYDAIPLRYKERYLVDPLVGRYYHRRLSAYSGFADNLCISEFSKSELESIHPSTNAANIGAGVSRRFSELAKHACGGDLGLGTFVLYVGGLDWRKNVGAIVRAFGWIERLWSKNETKLVIAGDAPAVLLEAILEDWKREGLAPERLICLSHVSDQQLVSLYKQAKVLVQPSFMEGFGLTALEAVHCGTWVLAARAGALPEIISADELLFDPAEPRQLANSLIELLRPEETQDKEIVLKELQRLAERFTWKHSAAVAVERLSGLVQPAARVDILKSRKQTAAILKDSVVDRDVAVRCLALSEPSLSPRRLLIDATSTARVDHKTGIQRVVKKICTALAKGPDSAVERMFVFRDDNAGWFSIDGHTLAPPQKARQRPVAVGRDIMLMLDSSWEFHDLYWRDWRACRLRKGQVISCLYDMVPLKMPAMCHPGMPPAFAQWFQRALTWSTGFVCISRAVADELLSMLEAVRYPRRMTIGYWKLGADFLDKGTLATQQVLAARRPCFLMVGTLEPRKGYRIALDAFEELWGDRFDVELTIVGKPGWGVSNLVERIRRHPELGTRLNWRESADDAELCKLYSQCEALIAASFAEGFGLPIVEAGHFGKPVIASDIPVFREVGGGAAHAQYFRAGDPGALAQAVKAFLGVAERQTTSKANSKIWPNWVESAAELENVVLEQNWYKVYEPNEGATFSSFSNLGSVGMVSALPPSERSHRLEIIEGPYLSPDGNDLKIVVALTNQSSTVWSSIGDQEGRFAISLSFHICSRDGAIIQHDNPRTRIPFVQCPGDTIFLEVNVPSTWRARGAAFADIELVQESVAWFGSALRVAL